MNVWMYIGFLVLGNITAMLIGRAITKLFHLKFSLCDMKLLSELYVRIWVELVVGCALSGLIFMLYFQNSWMGVIYGVLFYASIMFITDMRQYNRLTKSLKILNIDTDEKLNKFIEDEF
jgi:hypothetical protein